MKKKVLLTRRLHDFALKDLKKNYSIQVHSGKIPMPRKKMLSKIADVDGLICFPYDNIDKEVIDAGENLSTISTYSVGYDHIDIDYAKKKRIKIGYTPDVLTDTTADLTITLMFDLLRRVTEGDRIIRSDQWREIYGAYDYVGTEISGKTLGILGMGRIGKQTARRAKVFGMNILYHNRHRISPKEEKILDAKYVNLDSLFKKSDVISVHTPYTKETHEMINLSKLKKMKRCAFLVNTARGKIIKECDLILALKKKIIAGAALDVFKTEPIRKSNELTKMENVILTPHIGSSTDQTRKEMAKITVKNLKLGLSGKDPIYSVK